ncbi:hypothetical protein ALC57_11658 [Trachymyrmex cornetzi]|uniref:Uncharacterized protein n=1 Tax=Trachymyrmex cornetzi TaxID=471704 RepID=A0A195DTG7_9HYME|nr:hypothetical protein ALC57_11658 [Trachymyrmex cornetzi]
MNHKTVAKLLSLLNAATGSFCSLGLFEYLFGQPRPCLSCLYILTTWSYFTYSFYYPYILKKFSFHLLHRNIQFTINGYFTLDNTFLHSVKIIRMFCK